MQWVRVTSIIENNLMVGVSFFPDPLSLTLPSLTLETTSGICELNRDLFLTKEKIQESMQCLAWWQCFWIKWCWSLGAGKWLFCKLKKRYKTQVHEDIIKKKTVLIPAATPPFFPVLFLFIKNTFHHECESRCGHLLPVSQVSSGILVT